MTLDEFMQEMSKHEYEPHIRYGQHLFNSLNKIRPDVANIIRATDCDPFYNDKKIGKFWFKVCELW